MGQASSSKSSPPSQLEVLLRQGRWDEVRSFLCTVEGRAEVEAGLTSHHGGSTLRTPALYAALFHRAPLDVVEAVHGVNPDGLGEEDLHCALDRGPEVLTTGDARRRWHRTEREAVIEFLVDRSPPAAFTRLESVSSGTRVFTPLGYAVENPDVSPRVVRRLCFEAPEAMEVECTFDGEGVLPLSLSVGQDDKMNILLRGSTFFAKSGEVSDWEKVVLPPIDAAAYEHALRTAAKAEDWSLLEALLPAAKESGMSEESWNEFRRLAEENRSRERKQDEADAWRRRNFGPVMYEVDVLTDLVSPIVPKRFRRKERRQRALRNARLQS